MAEMYKSLDEMNTAIVGILSYIRDGKFDFNVITKEFGGVTAGEALYTCANKGYATGIEVKRTFSDNSLDIKWRNPRITYDGLEFIESSKK